MQSTQLINVDSVTSCFAIVDCLHIYACPNTNSCGSLTNVIHQRTQPCNTILVELFGCNHSLKHTQYIVWSHIK